MLNQCLELKNCSVFHPKFFLVKSFCLTSNIKHSTQCFISRWNILNTPQYVLFSTLFSAVFSFHTGGRQSLSWWRHYLWPHTRHECPFISSIAKVPIRLECGRIKERSKEKLKEMITDWPTSKYQIIEFYNILALDVVGFDANYRFCGWCVLEVNISNKHFINYTALKTFVQCRGLA